MCSRGGKTQQAKKSFWRQKIDPYILLARLDRQTGNYIIYSPCAWSIALASLPGTIPLKASIRIAVIFIIGVVLMRSAGCTINDIWDKDIDAKVERTKKRPLASGALGVKQAVVFLVVQLVVGFFVLLQLNCCSVILGASGFVLVIIYPLTKRFINHPQIFLGAAVNWGVLVSYSAIQGIIDLSICLPAYIAAWAWIVMLDTIYAYQDRRDDIRIGVKSTAVTLGESAKLGLTIFLVVSILGLMAVGHNANMSMLYYLAVVAYIAHAARQIYTLDIENPEDCAEKFKSNATVGLVILLGILGGGYQQYMKNRQNNYGKDNLDIIKSCLCPSEIYAYFCNCMSVKWS